MRSMDLAKKVGQMHTRKSVHDIRTKVLVEEEEQEQKKHEGQGRTRC